VAGEPGADGLTMHQALLLGGLSLIGQHLISTPRNLHGAIKRNNPGCRPYPYDAHLRSWLLLAQM
jgi:hypothetical protein